MKHVVLGLLAAGPAHGYEVRRRYDELFAGSGLEVNVGQIYVTLGRLEREGLINHTAEASGVGRDRKVYRLTGEGTKALQDWLAEPQDLPLVKPDVLLKLATARQAAGLFPELEPRAIITGHRQRCLEALRDLNEQAGRAERGSVGDLLIQATALHLQAELRWLEACEQQLTRMSSPTGDDHD